MMIATLLIIYLVMAYIYKIDKIILYKGLMITCIILSIPIILYTGISFYIGEIDVRAITIMTLI